MQGNRPCAHCKTPFSRRKGDSASQWAARRFCSHECYAASLRKPTASKTCDHCGGEFERPGNLGLALWATRRFCDRPCAIASRRADETGRFWAKVDRRGPEDCWPWQGAVQNDENGRGRFKWEGRLEYVYRIAYELLIGPIGDGLHAHHTCDDPSCVNPRHVELLTHKEHAEVHAAERRGVPRTPEVRARISRVLKSSPRNRAAADARQGIPRSPDVIAKVIATKRARRAV